MSYDIISFNKNSKTISKGEVRIQTPLAMSNRLKELLFLSQSLFQQVKTLTLASQSEATVIESINDGGIDLEKEVQNFEAEMIRCALLRTGGKQRRAAQLLNVKVSTLNSKIKRYGISTDSSEVFMGIR